MHDAATDPHSMAFSHAQMLLLHKLHQVDLNVLEHTASPAHRERVEHPIGNKHIGMRTRMPGCAASVCTWAFAAQARCRTRSSSSRAALLPPVWTGPATRTRNRTSPS